MLKKSYFKKIIHENRKFFRLYQKISLILFIILMGAVAISLVESEDGNINSFFDAVWWSLVTITTVGYGDLYPVSFWGRIVGIVFIFLGFISFSTFTAYIASGFIDSKIKERKGLNKIKLKNHVVICGWNSSSNRILHFLSSSDDISQRSVVLVNELDEGVVSSIVSKYEKLHIKYIKGDFTDQEILNRANIKEAEQIILLYDESKPDSAPSDERTIIAAHNVSSLKIKSKINIQLKEKKYLPSIQLDKIQNVIIYDEIGGDLLANATVNSYIPNVIQDIVRFRDGVGLKETKIPEEYIGQYFKNLFDYFRVEKNLILIGVVTENPDFSINDILSDDSSNIDKFIKRQFEISGKKLAIKTERNNIKIKPADDYKIDSHDIAIVL